jgi:hypothetical protein
MIAFEDYVKIKNNYCICYFGPCNEYLVLLELLRPKIEASFPGMNFYIGCKDSCLPFLSNRNKILPISELKVRKKEFAHIKELQYNNQGHPIQNILEESEIENIVLGSLNFGDRNNKAIIVSENTYPTNPMNSRQITTATRIAESRGFYVEISNDWRNAGLVIGVESEAVIRSAHAGVATILSDTGVGTNFYKKIFPDLELLPN